MCRWELAYAPRGDDLALLKRAHSASLAATLPLPSGHRVTALTAHNAVLSHIVVAASSDRSIHVLDAAYEAPVATVTTAHERGITALQLLPPSPLTAHSSAAHSCLLSAGKDGVVLLWDIRVMQPVRFRLPSSTTQLRLAT